MKGGVNRSQKIYASSKDSFHLMRTYLYIIRHALKQKRKICVWSFYIPMYQCALWEENRGRYIELGKPCVAKYESLVDRLKDISTPSFNPGPFNPRLFNHEVFNHKFLNHGVENVMVEKSGFEMSFILLERWQVGKIVLANNNDVWAFYSLAFWREPILDPPTMKYLLIFEFCK